MFCDDPTNITNILIFAEILHVYFLLQMVIMMFCRDPTSIAIILIITLTEILHLSFLLHIMIMIFCVDLTNIATISTTNHEICRDSKFILSFTNDHYNVCRDYSNISYYIPHNIYRDPAAVLFATSTVYNALWRSYTYCNYITYYSLHMQQSYLCLFFSDCCSVELIQKCHLHHIFGFPCHDVSSFQLRRILLFSFAWVYKL